MHEVVPWFRAGGEAGKNRYGWLGETPWVYKPPGLGRVRSLPGCGRVDKYEVSLRPGGTDYAAASQPAGVTLSNQALRSAASSRSRRRRARSKSAVPREHLMRRLV